jgi:hypothetical protein
VKPPDLHQRIVSQLKTSPSSAHELAKSLDVTKSEVNSCLYYGRGIDFLVDSDRPPRWRLFDDKVISHEPIRLHRHIDGFAHVDFYGGDWNLEIRMAERSRNDPIASVESLGRRSRLIVVSNHVVSAREQEFQNDRPGLPDSAIAIAASVLAWEIFKELAVERTEDFDFQLAITQILLSIAAHARNSAS